MDFKLPNVYYMYYIWMLNLHCNANAVNAKYV